MALTAEQVRVYLSYDGATGLFVVNKASKKRAIGPLKRSFSRDKYHYVWLYGRQYTLHRVAWLLTYGEWPTGQIDHINRDCSDNRIENLRLATASQNMGNAPKPCHNTSGYKGVSFCRERDQWTAQIKINKKTVFLGRYESAIKAALSYDEAARIHFGDYALTNFGES